MQLILERQAACKFWFPTHIPFGWTYWAVPKGLTLKCWMRCFQQVHHRLSRFERKTADFHQGTMRLAKSKTHEHWVSASFQVGLGCLCGSPYLHTPWDWNNVQ